MKKKILSSILVISLIILLLFLPTIVNDISLLLDTGDNGVDIVQDVKERYEFIEFQDNAICYTEGKNEVSVNMQCKDEEYKGSDLLNKLEEVSRFTLLEAEDQFDWPEKVDVFIKCSDGRELSYTYYRTILDEEDGYEYVMKDTKY